jgi:capsular exopolysaccharide synthesis family protein
MTTIPTTARPAPQAAARPPVSGSATGVPIAIDPIKLLKKYKWLLGIAAAVGAVLGTISHFVLLKAYPVWSPYAVFECLAIEDSISKLGAQQGFRDELEKFMATQVQILTSDQIVDATVQNPNLAKEAPKWSAQFVNSKGVLDTTQAAKSLRKNLSASIMGESSLIRLSFWWHDPADAVSIVQLVSDTYMALRSKSATGTMSDRRDAIVKQIGETNNNIKELQERRERYFRDVNLETLDDQQNSVQRNISRLNEKLVDQRLDKEALITERNRMQRELENPAGITYPDEIRKKVDEDPTILSIKNQLNSLEAEMTAMGKRLGPNHPAYLKLQTLLEGTQQSLATQREKLLRQFFDAKLDSITSALAGVQANEADLIKKIEDARTRAVELAQTTASVKDLLSEITRLNDSRNKFTDDLKSLDILFPSSAKLARMDILQRAQRPKGITFPKIYIMVPLGMLFILGLTVGTILLIEVVDQRVKGPADVASIPRVRALGLIPHAAEDPSAPPKVETVFRDQPTGVMAEHFRQLRGQVLKRMQQGGLKSLLVMSGMPGSGATSVACNLAQAIATADHKVLLVDANFRRPGVHRVLGLKDRPGLADVLTGKAKFDEAVQSTDNPCLSVITAGEGDRRTLEQIAAAPSGELLRMAADKFEYIILDIAPASIAGDALAVANRCDATLLVVRAFGEKRGMVGRLCNELNEARAQFLGVVVNAARASAGGYLKGNIQASHEYHTSQSPEA